MAHLLSTENLVALLTLTALEIVLGIDNVVFLSILSGKLPRHEQARARRIGLGLALVARIALLLAISWVMRLTAPLFGVLGRELSGRDLILLLGGLFLLGKATFEIHDNLEGKAHGGAERAPASFGSVLVQIVLLDLVFSLDSVITAVGMAGHVGVMIAAVVVAVIVMMVFAGKVAGFIERHPTMKMLALSFLLLIGFTLMAEGLGQHVGKGYIYSAMAFSIFVELLNLRVRGGGRAPPVQLHGRYSTEPDPLPGEEPASKA